MKIISWNVNGARAREPLIRELVSKIKPDVLMLQEIKAPSKVFEDVFKDIKGYWSTRTENSFGGTAIYTKKPHEPKLISPAKTVVHYKNITFVNVYVPCGIKDKRAYLYKLDFLKNLKTYADELKGNIIIAGDMNVCRTPKDSFDPNHNDVTCTVRERDAFKSLLGGLVDCGNIGEPTWFDYRDYKFNQGLRLDYFLVSKGLKGSVKYKAFSSYRTKERPSDHLPIGIILRSKPCHF